MRAKVIAVLTFLLLCFSSSQAGNQKVLYTFTGGLDGGLPLAGVVFDQAGNLYGTTFNGGASGLGAVFQLTPTANGPWTETVLYSFTGGPDGSIPSGGLAIDNAGNLYGGTSDGGDFSHCGTVFKLSPSPSGWIFTVLHTFLGGEDGCSPQADFALFGNTTLVSTTRSGGAANQGTVFLLPVSGGNDELVPFRGSNGRFPSGAVNEFNYGTTIFGGKQGQGNVFEWSCCAIKTIHTFKSTGTGGYNPMGSLAPQLVDGGLSSMYGTTSEGGVGHSGTVYRLTASQVLFDVWSLSLIHAFSGPDGANPGAGVILDSAGSLYGTTEFGGADPGFAGTVFKLTPGPNNTWTHNLLYSFSGAADGGNLASGLVLDSAGNLYGTTLEGGTFNQGVVYEIVKITATLKPATLTFGPQQLNTTSPPQRITLFNHTAFPINVTSVSTQGDFAISTNKCQNSVKPGTHCDVFVTYTPTGLGTKPRTGTLTFVDNAFNGPQTAGLAGTVPAITRTAVTTSGSPSSVGQPVTFIAMVTSTQGAIPDGDLVTFSDGTTILGSAPTASGAAAFTTASLSARSHIIKASYAGDPAFDPSAGAVMQVVQKYSTTTVLKSHPNPSTSGQRVTISATVASVGPTPTGKVWFKDGKTGIATVVLTNGVATLVKLNFTVGTHPLTAEYLGDAAFAQSTSQVLNQVVQSTH